MSDADSLNDQVRDSLDQLQRTLEGMQQPAATGAALQTVAHALGLALHNAVARQQHSHMLRNAMTAAATRAILDGHPEKAEAVLKLAESPLVNPTFATEVTQLRSALAGLREDLEKVLSPAAPASGAA